MTHLIHTCPPCSAARSPSIASAARPTSVIPTTLPISFSQYLIHSTDLPVLPTRSKMFSHPTFQRALLLGVELLGVVLLDHPHPCQAVDYFLHFKCAPAPWIGEVLEGRNAVHARARGDDTAGDPSAPGVPIMMTRVRIFLTRRKMSPFPPVGRAPPRRFRARECLASTPERTWASPARRKGFDRW